MPEPVNIDNYRQSKRTPPDEVPLQHGGGGGTYGGMDIVDAKIAAAEARTDVKFERVISKLDHLDTSNRSQFDDIKTSTHGIKTTVIVTAIAAVTLAAGIMAFGASQFGNGVMVTSAAVNDAKEAKRIAEENAVEVKALRQDISQFIQAFQKSQPPQ